MTRAEYNRRYYIKNRETLLLYSRVRYAKDPLKYIVQATERYWEHKVWKDPKLFLPPKFIQFAKAYSGKVYVETGEFPSWDELDRKYNVWWHQQLKGEINR